LIHLKENGNRLKGFKKKYGKVTKDAYTEVEGSFEKLAGKIQEHYRKSKEELKNE